MNQDCDGTMSKCKLCIDIKKKKVWIRCTEVLSHEMFLKNRILFYWKFTWITILRLWKKRHKYDYCIFLYCSECPNYDLIVPVLLKEGISALPDHCQLSPGVPLKPMLAHPTAGIDKVLERFDKNAFTCEFKYDGERAQVYIYLIN